MLFALLVWINMFPLHVEGDIGRLNFISTCIEMELGFCEGGLGYRLLPALHVVFTH